ncbi:MAG TPA: hypothetical protein VGV61_16885 [Thermoanaerobaculia bacterium]|nr:hypothetical protein [Thermoanaerobaculia bacterium]
MAGLDARARRYPVVEVAGRRRVERRLVLDAGREMGAGLAKGSRPAAAFSTTCSPIFGVISGR